MVALDISQMAAPTESCWGVEDATREKGYEEQGKRGEKSEVGGVRGSVGGCWGLGGDGVRSGRLGKYGVEYEGGGRVSADDDEVEIAICD